MRKILENKGSKTEFKGDGWYTCFMERWPHFSLHKVDSLGQACANATTSSNIKEYYILLEKTLNDNNH